MYGRACRAIPAESTAIIIWEISKFDYKYMKNVIV